MKHTKCRFRQAFTLIELLVVIAVIAILASILIPSFTHVLTTAAAVDETARQRNIGQAMMSYCMDRKTLIPQLYFHQRATADSTVVDSSDQSQHGHLAWVLKGYLGGSNLQDERINPTFASTYWMKRIEGANGSKPNTSNPQPWFDANRSGCYRYNMNSWEADFNCSGSTSTQWFPFPRPLASNDCGVRQKQFSVDQIDFPASTMMLCEADNTIGLYTTVLPTPAFKDFRVSVFWDASVEKVHIADYQNVSGNPDPNAP